MLSTCLRSKLINTNHFIPYLCGMDKGLGDTVDRFTTATGIKSVVKKTIGRKCGCEKRRKKLNELFPYK